jgi:hypothetical protein
MTPVRPRRIRARTRSAFAPDERDDHEGSVALSATFAKNSCKRQRRYARSGHGAGMQQSDLPARSKLALSLPGASE